MCVAERTLPHVCHFDCTFRACVHKDVATLWMELGRGDNFRELFHVCRLDINNIEALILYVEVPEVYAEVVAADEGLAVTVGRNAVDVVRMSICVYLSRYGGDNGIMMGHTGKLELGDVAECGVGVPDRSTAICVANAGWSELLG